eukprot:1637675-Karenia_brevis.AAC.1
MPLKVPSPSSRSSESSLPGAVGEHLRKRGVRKNWNDDGMAEEEEESSSSSSSRHKPVIQDADNQAELIAKFQESQLEENSRSSK